MFNEFDQVLFFLLQSSPLEIEKYYNTRMLNFAARYKEYEYDNWQIDVLLLQLCCFVVIVLWSFVRSFMKFYKNSICVDAILSFQQLLYYQTLTCLQNKLFSDAYACTNFI